MPCRSRIVATLFVLLSAWCGASALATTITPITGQLGLPEPLPVAPAHGPYPPGTHLVRDRPHPAVARIVVPEGNATSYGSGTLVDARGQFGLVVTNWHVVRDGNGEVEVIFPDGFRSLARPLKVDSDWDLAALVIWRPPVAPVAMAAAAPQPGNQLTICGYGSGQYRAVTGRCTQYYSPAVDLPQHMVELDVEARQGDSGGPIFNERGELAGVLFGAGQGTTLGSFGGRVGSFLATLAPDIGRAAETSLAHDERLLPPVNGYDRAATAPDGLASAETTGGLTGVRSAHCNEQLAALRTVAENSAGAPADGSHPASQPSPAAVDSTIPSTDWFDHAKSVLAAIGALAVLMQVMRTVT